MKILYVDDEKTNLQLFAINFRKNFTVFTAKSGNDGLDILNAENDIKVVVSDMKMPGMNGIEFISKANEQFPHKKYFILTGYDITDEIEDALDSGLINEYFMKPVNMKEIEKTIIKATKN